MWWWNVTTNQHFHYKTINLFSIFIVKTLMTRIIQKNESYPAYDDVDLNFFDFCSIGSSPSVSSSLDVSDFISLWKSPFLRFDCCCSNCLTKQIQLKRKTKINFPTFRRGVNQIRLTLLFQNFILSLQIVDVLLMGEVLTPHELNEISGLFQYLSSTRCFLSLQRWNRFFKWGKTVFYVIATLSFQCVVMSSFFSLKMM